MSIKKNTFKLSVRTIGGFRGQASGECEESIAFALYMLSHGKARGVALPEGVAGEFQKALDSYLDAAEKYYAEIKAEKAVH